MDSRWQRIAVCFAGPFAGFCFLGLVFAILAIRDPTSLLGWLEVVKSSLGMPPTENVVVIAENQMLRLQSPLEYFLVYDLIFINLIWGLVNLLPVWPLDGGQICRDVSEIVSPENGLKGSLGISLVTAGLLAVHCVTFYLGRPLLPLRFGSPLSACFFGMFALQSFMLLQQIQAQNRHRNNPWDYQD
jgi:stage IV sporulation protein FB